MDDLVLLVGQFTGYIPYVERIEPIPLPAALSLNEAQQWLRNLDEHAQKRGAPIIFGSVTPVLSALLLRQSATLSDEWQRPLKSRFGFLKVGELLDIMFENIQQAFIKNVFFLVFAFALSRFSLTPARDLYRKRDTWHQ